MRLARSLDDLVDRPNPIELLKVKLVCGVEDVSVIIVLSLIVIRGTLFFTIYENISIFFNFLFNIRYLLVKDNFTFDN